MSRHARATRWIRTLAAATLLLLMIPGCDDDGGDSDASGDLLADTPDGDTDAVTCVDEDDADCDGVPASLDCDDQAADIFPGAPDNATLHQWQSAPVAEDLSFTSEHSALAIADDGTLHVALISESESALYYAHSARPGAADGEFELEEAAAFDFSPRDAALALAPDGTVHITVEDQIDGELEHLARSPAGAWQRTVVEAGSDTGRHSALAVAPDGTLHLSFVGDGGALRYGQLRDGTWSLRELVAATNPGGRSALARASDGTLYAALGVAASGGPAVHLATSRDDGQTWTLTEVGSATGATGAVSLALAPDGAPYLAWHDTGSNRAFLAVAPADASPRPIEEIVSGGGLDLSLDLAPDATPYLAFKLGSDLAWAWRSPDGRWQQAIIDDSGEAGTEPALAVAPTGAALHIVYGANGGLHHATAALPDGIDQSCDGIDGIDADQDGHASLETGGADCSDTDPQRLPGASDSFGDDVDQDCDGADGRDADHDGFAGSDSGGPDCDDADPARNPNSDDEAGDGIDQNCDGLDGTDGDGDGHANRTSGGADCDDRDAQVYPGAADAFGDDEDQNCDGVDGTDADGDGHASASEGGTDCNDADFAIRPGVSDNLWQLRTLFPDMEASHDTNATWVAAAVAADGRLGIVVSGRKVFYLELASADAAPDETLLTDDFWGRPPGLLFDAQGLPHVAYIEGSVEAHYATRDATGVWTREAIEPGETDTHDSDPRIALAPSGELQFAWSEHFSSTEAAVRHAVRTGDGTWQVDPVFGDVSVSADRLAFATDSLGHPLMVLADPLRLVRRDAPGSWVEETIGDGVAVYADLVVDPSDGLHVVCQGSEWRLLYRSRAAGASTWSEVEVDALDEESRGAHARVLLDDDGRPHLVWLRYRTDDNQLRYATQRPDGDFDVMVVDPGGTNLTNTPAFARAPDGTLYAVYVDDRRALKLAHTGAAPDGVDQNCDGVDGIDADGDGLASLATGGTDCDDADAAVGDCG